MQIEGVFCHAEPVSASMISDNFAFLKYPQIKQDNNKARLCLTSAINIHNRQGL
jgi:hypothetical protein